MGEGLRKVAQELRCRARKCDAQLACSLLTLRRPVVPRDNMHVPIQGCREITLTQDERRGRPQDGSAKGSNGLTPLLSWQRGDRLGIERATGGVAGQLSGCGRLKAGVGVTCHLSAGNGP